jgi:transcriptional regulator with XRE-family HTH domain
VTVGTKVRELREQQHLSQEALAFKAGVSVATVTRIERGIGGNRTHTVSLIARALDVPVGDLLNGGGEAA